jgi:hypothetical protein
MKSTGKENIWEMCRQTLMKRIATAEQAMKEAQEGSNSEDKSSAGDKYETARAMGQLDRDMNARQLVQVRKELTDLQKIDLQPSLKARTGSLITCNTAVYFIAVGLGPILVDGKTVIVLSPQSPLAKLMIGKTEGEQFPFNQGHITIQKIA